MADIFDYKPNLEYTLGEIDTIDNIHSEDISIIQNFIRDNGSDVLDAININLERINNDKAIIDQRLKDVTVSINPRVIDDLVANYAKAHNDGEKLINEGIVTYGFYKYALDIEPLSQIVYAWDMQHASIDGIIEAELLPQLEYIEKDLELLRDLIDKTINYEKDYSNTEELKTRELEEIENLARLNREIESMYYSSQPDIEQIMLARRRYESKETKLRLKKTINQSAMKFTRGVSRILDLIENRLDIDTQKKEEDEIKRQAEAMINKLTTVGYDEKKAKLLIYQNFKSKRDSLVAKKQDMDNVSKGKANTYRGIVTNTRLYLDVALPAIDELQYILIDTDEEEGFSNLLDGASDIVNAKQASMIELKNTLKASTQLIYKQTKGIIEKDRTRTIYKSL